MSITATCRAGTATTATGALSTLLLVAACDSPRSVSDDAALRAETFDAMVAAVEDNSAPFLTGQRRRGELAARFRDEAIEAESASAYYRTLVAALSELDDPHASLELPEHVAAGLFVPWVHVTAYVDGATWVAIGPPIVKPGDPRLLWTRLVSVDGRPVPRMPLLDQTLAGEAGAVRRLGCRTVDGVDFEVVEPCAARMASLGDVPRLRVRIRASAGDGTDRPQDVEVGEFECVRLGHRGEVALLRIESLDTAGHDLDDVTLCRKVQELCESARGAEVVLIDLRRNLGGHALPMLQLVTAFIEDRSQDLPLITAQPARVRRPGNEIVQARSIVATRVRPSPDLPAPIDARLIVLVDDWSASGAEYAATILRCREGATIVGGRTLGAEWMAYDKQLPDGSIVSFGVGGGVDESCGRFQGIGVVPDVEIPYPHELAANEGPTAGRTAFDDAILREGLSLAGLDPQVWMQQARPDAPVPTPPRSSGTLSGASDNDGARLAGAS